jgi:hypothetical protein
LRISKTKNQNFTCCPLFVCPCPSHSLTYKVSDGPPKGEIVSPYKAFNVAAKKSLGITLGSSSKTYRGFLMRISQGSTDTSSYLKASTDANVQVVSLCTLTKIGGIGHKNNSDKKSVKGTLNVPRAMKGLSNSRCAE